MLMALAESNGCARAQLAEIIVLATGRLDSN